MEGSLQDCVVQAASIRRIESLLGCSSRNLAANSPGLFPVWVCVYHRQEHKKTFITNISFARTHLLATFFIFLAMPGDTMSVLQYWMPPTDKVPWFLQSNLLPTKSLQSSPVDDDEHVCAEILSSLTALIPHDTKEDNLTEKKPIFVLEKIDKDSKRRKKRQIRYKRNINPCSEHRRKHQRCPSTCQYRTQTVINRSMVQFY